MVKEKELTKLQAKTPKSERKYRVGNTFDYSGKKYANMLCYIDARYVMDTLDKIVGVGNWDNEYFEIKRNLYCKITIRFEKEDGTIRYGVLYSSLWHNRGDTGPSLAEQMNMKGCRWRTSDRSRV